MNITHTPWGLAQTCEELAPGISLVTTASHGGIYLSAARANEFQHVLPGFVPFTRKAQWLEEDCDAALAGLVWPDLGFLPGAALAAAEFHMRDIYTCFKPSRELKTVRERREHNANVLKTFLASPRGQAVRALALGEQYNTAFEPEPNEHSEIAVMEGGAA